MKGIVVTKKHYAEARKIVYDIEVEDNHNFVAEHYLVHNCAVFAAKKKYYMRVRDDEGKRFPEDAPDIKIQGMDIIKGGTPQFAKNNLMNAIPVILDSNELSIRDYVRDTRMEYLSNNLGDISQTQGVSRVDYNLGDKGVPQGSRCALVYNKYITDNGLDDQYSLINAGDRIKKVFLLEPNKFKSNIIGYIDDNFAKEIPLEFIDYEKMFDKGFLSMLELMTEPLNWNITVETAPLDDW